MMRKNLRKSSIALAVAAAGVGVAGLSTQAIAVQLADDGLGEVLLYPYFNTKNSMKTFVHVINTSDKAVAFKIRIHDAKNSRECRDFNVVLSPEDVWTSSIEEGADGQPRIWTADKSCTSPQLPFTDRGGRYVNFTAADFDGRTVNGQDSADVSIDRCREGYVEIIEMGASTGGTYFDAAKHIDGVPADCATIAADFNDNAKVSGPISAEFNEPENVLKGNYSLIRAEVGQGFGGTPTTLANFFSPGSGTFGIDGVSTQYLVRTAGDNEPNLSNVNPPVSIVDDVSTGSGVFIDGWTRSVDAVSAILMRKSVINEWSTNAAFGVNTDWIVTFPTKSFYADPSTPGVTAGSALPPFAETFNQQNDARACIDVEVASWNREEKTEIFQQGFSPVEVRQGNQLCFESNVITFNRGSSKASVLNSQFTQNVENGTLGNNGWVRLGLTKSLSALTGLTAAQSNTPSQTPRTYQGLPVIGFTVFNRRLEQASINFGTLFDHAYERMTLESGN